MTKGKSYAFNKFLSANTYARAKSKNMRVHFKNTVETANALRGLKVNRATKYLQNVIERKECVPFRKFKGCIGRTAQAKQFKTTQGRWPRKSAKFLLELIQNAVSNAEFAGLDCDQLQIASIQVNPASARHRRTYRAHGVINPYMSHNCHSEIVLTPFEK